MGVRRGVSDRGNVARERLRYLSYLLRLWRVTGRTAEEAARAGEAWQASLESAATRERWHFHSLEELFDFLRRQVSVCAGNSENDELSSEEANENESGEENHTS